MSWLDIVAVLCCDSQLAAFQCVTPEAWSVALSLHMFICSHLVLLICGVTLTRVVGRFYDCRLHHILPGVIDEARHA